MEFILKYKRQLAVSIAVLIIFLSVFGLGFYTSKTHWQAPLIEEIDAFKVGQKRYEDALLVVKGEMDEQAKKSQQIIQEKDKRLDDISSAYETEKKKEKIRTVYIKDPNGHDVPIHFDPANNIVCDRFQETFTQTINQLVDEVNK